MMENLTEQKVREIVQDEMRRNYMSGSPDVPPHSHNGTDNLNISTSDIEGFTPVPTTGRYLNRVTGINENGVGVLGNSTLNGLVGGDNTHISQYLLDARVMQYPVPVIVGNGVGTQGSFNGGYAPEGTLVFFANGSTLSGLYIRFDGEWKGVNFNLVV